MDMTGEYRIPAPRQRVWEALNDPEILKAAIPGCEELNKLSDRDLEARVKAKVGPVSATFTGKVTLGDLNPPESYTISGEGKGGAAGFAKGGAEVRLADDGPATVLRYTAKADVGGKLAQIGSRLVQGAAKKTADDFFGRFSRIVADRHAAEAPAAAGPAVAAPTAATAAPNVHDVGTEAATAAPRGVRVYPAPPVADEVPPAPPAGAVPVPPPAVARPSIDAALPPPMNAEAAAGGTPPFVPDEPAATPPEPVAHRHAAVAAHEAAETARAASTMPQPATAAGETPLMQRPLTWAAVAVVVLVLLFLIF